ncbi:hypothetical protein [Aneurinibacillus migulanus]|nr:hypothetical protein [Aneurinibacillus migulanus]MCP1356121.1 hypothetical protein [Aneurinibacillus migulanus]
MNGDFKLVLEQIEKVSTWLPSYRKYEKETDEPLGFFEWILLNNNKEN